MQTSAPEALDLTRETGPTRSLYGLDDPASEDFGRRCLFARRLIERGVRFVQVWSGAGGPKNNWDNHSDILTELPTIARTVDQPIAGHFYWTIVWLGQAGDVPRVIDYSRGPMPTRGAATATGLAALHHHQGEDVDISPPMHSMLADLFAGTVPHLFH